MLDADLSLDARMVAIYLLSLSDGWEVSQRAIATALGLPSNSRRVGRALQGLIGAGWLQRNEYRKGDRVYKYEYVMNRSHKLNVVESTPYNVVESTTSIKDHSKEGNVEPSITKEDPWTVSA